MYLALLLGGKTVTCRREVGTFWGEGKINTNVAVASFSVLHAITKCSSSPYVL